MFTYAVRALTGRSGTQKRLKKHFHGAKLEEIVTGARSYPLAARVDLHSAVDHFFASRQYTLLGIHTPFGHETPTLAHLLTHGPYPVEIGPLQHDEIDTGEVNPVRCLNNGLWLTEEGGIAFAVLLSPTIQYGMVGGVHLEIAVPKGERGLQLSQQFFREVESSVNAGRTYRGKVLSLERKHLHERGGEVKVHRLRSVRREEVILPEKTLKLLDRNVAQFISIREQIKGHHLSAKKGLLFYGPPGTGKTHTIHYLASQLPGHTTLLVTAEQVAFIDEYFRLARFLQPSLLIIEDVDLIALDRNEMTDGCGNVLLNKLLNEMDGLREDADIFCILTTNRPEHLERALAARPGRIDQAIEFPLPDDAGRAKLVRLYARGLDVPEAVVNEIVRRTRGASPAFIKELMRRSAQFHFEAGQSGPLPTTAAEGALEEMLFCRRQPQPQVVGRGHRRAVRPNHQRRLRGRRKHSYGRRCGARCRAQ